MQSAAGAPGGALLRDGGRSRDARAVASLVLPLPDGLALGPRLLLGERHRPPVQPQRAGVQRRQTARGRLLVVPALVPLGHASVAGLVGGLVAVVQACRVQPREVQRDLAHRAQGEHPGVAVLAGGEESGGRQRLGALPADPAAAVPHAALGRLPGLPPAPVQTAGLSGLQHPDVPSRPAECGHRSLGVEAVHVRLPPVVAVHAGGGPLLRLPLGFPAAPLALQLGVLLGCECALQRGPQCGGRQLGTSRCLGPHGVFDGPAGTAVQRTLRHLRVGRPLLRAGGVPLSFDGLLVRRVHDLLQAGGVAGAAAAHGVHRLVRRGDGEGGGLAGHSEAGLRGRLPRLGLVHVTVLDR